MLVSEPECMLCMLFHRYESAAASLKVYLQSYLSPELAAADNSRESSPLHASSTRTAKVVLLHKSTEPSAHDASVISYIVRQVSFEFILNIVLISVKDITCVLINVLQSL